MVKIVLYLLCVVSIVILQLSFVNGVKPKKEDDGNGNIPPQEDDTEANIEVEDDDNKSTKGESDNEKNETKSEDDLPKTVRISGKDIPIERADRTITAEVIFEISFGNENVGNITFGLFGKTCPKTVRNFVTLANPLKPSGEGYKGSTIHRIVKGFAIQGGDFINNDGSGGWSIYGRFFRDENFAINHFPFCLSMANSGPDTNASQFFIPLIRTKWLNGKHVVFGQVTAGHKVVKSINDIRTNRYSRPLRQVWISKTWTKMKNLDTSRNSEL